MNRVIRQSLLPGVVFCFATVLASSAEERREASQPGSASTAAPDPGREGASAPKYKGEEKSPDAIKRQELVKIYGEKAADAILAGKVLKDMTPEQVRLSRGEPVSKEVIPPDAELWRYAEGEVAFSGGKVTYVDLKERKPSPVAAAPDMVRISGGCFQMGSPNSERDHDSDERQHQVCVQAFWIGKYEVTQGEWRTVMGNNPSLFSNCGDSCPVEQVSWNEVQEFLAKLNARSGRHYRLPTEAEWEYACRGGRDEDLYCGGNDLNSVAWYDGNSGDQTHPVGEKAANGYGLHDMSGNVWEWTCSLYEKELYDSPRVCVGRNDGGDRSRRGGSWDYNPARLRATFRFRYAPDNRNGGLGFRLAQD